MKLSRILLRITAFRSKFWLSSELNKTFLDDRVRAEVRKFIRLCLEDPLIEELVKDKEADGETLLELYYYLRKYIGFQEIHGHYPLLASFYTPEILHFILQSFDGKIFRIHGLSEKESLQHLAEHIRNCLGLPEKPRMELD